MDHFQIRHERKEIPDHPQRIVSLNPSVTEILYELGMEDRIAGVSAFCARPPATSKKRRVGSYGTARSEVLEELNPDLIFVVTGYQEKFYDRFSKRFNVVMLELPVTVAGIIDLVTRVGNAVSKVREAKALARSLIRSLPDPIDSAVSGYFEIDLGGPVSFGRHSHITDALSMYGFDSIYGNENKEWLKPDDNFLFSRDPEVIIYEPKMYSKFTDKSLQKLIDGRGWNRLSAWKAGKLFVTPGPLDFFAHHGPSFIREVLPWLSSIMQSVSGTSRS